MSYASVSRESSGPGLDVEPAGDDVEANARRAIASSQQARARVSPTPSPTKAASPRPSEREDAPLLQGAAGGQGQSTPRAASPPDSGMEPEPQEESPAELLPAEWVDELLTRLSRMPDDDAGSDLAKTTSVSSFHTQGISHQKCPLFHQFFTKSRWIWGNLG